MRSEAFYQWLEAHYPGGNIPGEVPDDADAEDIHKAGFHAYLRVLNEYETETGLRA